MSIAPNIPGTTRSEDQKGPRVGETPGAQSKRKRYTTLERIEVTSQDKKEILPESPNLVPKITATNGGIIMTNADKIPASTFGAR